MATLLRPILLLLGVCCLSAPYADASLRSRRLTVQGRARRYLVYAPKVLPQAMPLVIVLHGHQGGARRIMRMSGMNAKADQAGFLVAYPEGSRWAVLGGGSWNADHCCGYARARAVDDVAFLKAMLERLRAEYRIDPHRVYVAGASNGAMMAYRLACELSDQIAAVASVSGTMQPEACHPSHPVSILMVHGTADTYVPYAGGDGAATADHRMDASQDAVAAFWVRHNGCVASPHGGRQGNVEILEHTDCQGTSATKRYTIHGGGHAWPGGRRGWLFGDRPTHEFLAIDAIWEFFERHPKP
ncbi:MAG: polyhydroxybutyrate depolymerase [Candidatus Omnitrophica bacterium CG11_big_fil_rev_8_21_14_0_20_63_9]|nr:MAG: polyhydroxybutyrate depolymerase [Candidatus Omnitrophica bacterium CG11_big_fil_rev_8_21_14_0_20_63_9]